jgi:hypothetical protein
MDLQCIEKRFVIQSSFLLSEYASSVYTSSCKYLLAVLTLLLSEIKHVTVLINGYAELPIFF